MVVGLLVTGCHRNVSAQNQANDLGPDPAAANMAPTDASQQGAVQQTAPAGQGTNEAITAARTASPNDQQPADQGYSDQSVDQGQEALDNGDYDDATEQADQAPPPLPEYSQPPIPDDGYLWTPGYWAWAPAGYYWVPGGWVMPPYQGALWTPSYWGYRRGHYYFYRGYWGHYIGYYGGINYGFGYGGRGYEGGYWRDNHFFYNRAVNNIRGPHINNVYVRNVTTRDNSRVSYNGPGGANLRPAPAEFAAMRQQRVQPMRTQVEAQHAASQNRQQFANVNRGRPAEVVSARPIQADHETRPMPAARIPVQQTRPNAGQQQNSGRPGQQQPGAVQQQRPGQQPAQQGQPKNFARPTAGQPMNRSAQQQTEQAHPAQQQGQQRSGQPQNVTRPTQSQPAQQARPVQQQRPAENNGARSAPAEAPQSAQPQRTPQNFQRHDATPQSFTRPAQQQQAAPRADTPAARPTPQQAARPAAAPQPAARPAAPAARPAAQARPAPAAKPAPQQREEEHPH